MELYEISDRLNAALEAAEFDEAVKMANEYRRRFDRIWAAMGNEARHSSDLPLQAVLLHQHAIGGLVKTRAAKAAEWRSLKRAEPYRKACSAQTQWKVTF